MQAKLHFLHNAQIHNDQRKTTLYYSLSLSRNLSLSLTNALEKTFPFKLVSLVIHPFSSLSFFAENSAQHTQTFTNTHTHTHTHTHNFEGLYIGLRQSSRGVGTDGRVQMDQQSNTQFDNKASKVYLPFMMFCKYFFL